MWSDGCVINELDMCHTMLLLAVRRAIWFLIALGENYDVTESVGARN